MSIAISRFGLVYVANAGNGGSNNYVGFRFHFNGTLTPIPGSTVTVPAGSGWRTCSSTPLATILSAPGSTPR